MAHVKEQPLPEYVRCVIKYTHRDGKQLPRPELWCGRETVPEFYFEDAAHALAHADQGGRILICPKCGERMRNALFAGTARICWECGGTGEGLHFGADRNACESCDGEGWTSGG